jgi:hypothetical protein
MQRIPAHHLGAPTCCAEPAKRSAASAIGQQDL